MKKNGSSCVGYVISILTDGRTDKKGKNSDVVASQSMTHTQCYEMTLWCTLEIQKNMQTCRHVEMNTSKYLTFAFQSNKRKSRLLAAMTYC